MSTLTPGRDLYNKIKAGFVAQGTSLGAWCKRNSIHPDAMRMAAIGAWDGPKARQVRARAAKAAKIESINIIGGAS